MFQKNNVKAQNLLIVDTDVLDSEILLADLQSDFKTIRLSRETDPVLQISQALFSHQPVREIILLAHANPGKIHFTDYVLDLTELDSRKDELRDWRNWVTDDARLSIYACQLASNETGRAFIQELGNLTGIAIAASSQLIGNLGTSQNWNLDRFTQPFEVLVPFSKYSLAEYPHQLAPIAPVLGDFSGTVSFAENLVNAVPQVIDAAVSFHDPDSADFDGGVVELFYTQNGEPTDQLGVRNQGSAPGQIGVSGSTVSYGGIAIGTLSGGNDGSNLSITLNANADAAAVEALIENLTYASTSQSPAASRTVGIRVSDGDGGTSAVSQVTINVTLELDGAPEVHAAERVNTHTTGAQEDPQVATLADGSYVVVWQSNGQDGSSWGIYGQRFDAQGVAVGAEFRVNTETASQQSYPQIAALSTGGFVVTWQDSSGADGSGWGVLGQRYSAAGNAADGNFVVNSHTSSTQYHSAVAAYDGGYAVVWTSSGNAGGNSADIYLQRYANDGSKVGGETLVSTTPGATTAQGGAQYIPAIATQANGNLVIAWNDSSSNDGNSHGVYARLFDAATQTFGDSFLVNSYTTGQQSSSDEHNGPEVAVLADGGFVVVWPSGGQDGSGWGIYGQRFDAAGNKLGGEFRVNESTSSNQYQAEITALSTGGFVVAWYNDGYGVAGSGSTQDVYIREYDTTGTAVDGERKLTGPSSVASNQIYHPAIADLGNGNFVVAYSAYLPTASGGNNTYEIFQNLFGDAATLARGSAAPVLSDVSVAVTYTEAAAKGAPQLIDPAVSLFDTDSANFDGGRVDVFYTQDGEATDQLGVRHQGTTPGQIGISGSTVSYGGVAIGTLAGGADGSNLSISLNTNATPDAVEALIENLTYASTADNPGTTRTIGIRVADGDGGISTAATVAINVQLDLATAVSVYGEETVTSYRIGTQEDPQVATLANGGYVVVWQSNGQDGSGWGIYGQRFDARGVAAGLEFRINTATSNQQSYPQIAALSAGGFVVTWQDSAGVDGSGWGVIGQRYDASGTAAGGNFVVNSHTNSTQYHSAVAAYDGGYAVVWTSSGNTGGNSADIYLQRYANDGSTVGGETRVSTTPGAATAQGGAQYVPSIAAQANGNLIIAWNDSSGADGNSHGVYARLFDAATQTLGNTFLVNTFTSGQQSNSDEHNGPEVAILADGSFVVVWPGSGQDGSGWGVYGQRFDAAGNKLGGEFRVNESTNGSQYQTEVTALSTGGFVVAWHNDNYDLSGTGTTQDIYIRQYDASGAPVDGERKLASPSNSVEQHPAIADLGNGNFIVVYNDYDTAASGGNNTYVIKQQIFGDPADFIRSSAAPVIDDVRALRTFTNNTSDPYYSGNAQVIDADVGVYDSDSADFAGGQLVVHLLNGAAAAEALGVRDQGTGAGQISVSGTTVSYGGVAIGNLSGGGAGADTLIVSLNANVDAAAVRALIENITYQNTAPASGSSDRYVGFRLSDGDGGVSSVANVQIRIQNSFSPAVLTLGDVEASLAITESQAQAGVLVDDAVALDYTGAAGFNGGRLAVSYVSSTGRVDDQLLIRNEGSGAGQIGFSGTDVSYGGVIIGSLSSSLNGANGAGLEISFNAAATDQAIERVIENLVYRNTSDGSNPSRTIRLDVRDANNISGGTRDVVIDIAAEADPDAAVPLFGEQQSNSYEAGSQQTPAVARLFGINDGGYVVAWVSDGGQDGESAGIFAQRYAADGSAVGPEFQVNSHTLGSQTEPAVAGLTGGGFILTWTSQSGQDGSSYGVFAQRYGADGVAQGAEFQVNTSTASNQYEPAVLGLADGGFVIAYRSDYSNTGSSYSYDVLGQRYAADGTALGSEFVLNTLISGTQYQPQLAALDGGGFVAIWTDSSGDSSGYGIIAQRFGADGSKQGGEIKVNTTETGTQQGPDVAGLAGGGFVATWHYNNNVYAQRFDASGAKAGPEILVNTVDSASNYNNYARVAALDEGGFVITWDSYYSLGGSTYDVLAQQFDAAGSKIDGAFVVNTVTASIQYQPDIAALGDGKFVIAWAGYNQEQGGTTSTYGVFHQLFGEAGAITRSAAPELLDLATSVTFAENLVNTTPQIIDAGVRLIDADSTNFDGGTLWVSIISGYGNITYAQLPEEVNAQDQLGIRQQGSAPGQIGISGNTVSYGGTVIGTLLSGGADGSDLVIRFNAAATPVAVEKLIENLTYANTSSVPVASRSISISVNDGDGGTSVPRIVTINVTPETDGAQPLFANERVNTYEPGTQDVAAIARLADGGYVVVWTSTGQDGWGNGVHGQRYDTRGVPVGSEFQINSYTPNDQSAATVSGLADGGYVVLWQSNGQDGSSWGIYGQRYDAAGVPAGGEYQVNTHVQNDQSDVDMAGLPSGGFVATWYSASQDGTYADIYFQRFAADGSKLGAETRANTSAGYENQFQGTPAITAFADGSFVIVWRGDGGQDGDGYGIFGQRFAADGNALGAEFQINSHGASYQYEPDVTTLADNGFVVVWRSDGQDGSSAGVFGQRYDASGNVVGDEFRVNIDTSGNQYQPSVSALSHGGFVIAWNDNSRTFVQQFDANGMRIDHPLRADTLDNNSNAYLPAVLGLADGAFVTVWRDYDYSTGSYNIHQQLFGTPGDLERSANPELVDVATRVTFRENLINATPQLIDPAVGLFDADSADFDGGILEVNYIIGYGAQDQLGLQGLAHQDQLGIRNQGSGTNEVGVFGTTVSFQGTAIGTILSNGQNGAKLTVLFNANATSDAVERVIENLTYANTVSNPIASRSISIRVTDGDGGASVAHTVQIDIIPEVDGAVPFSPEKMVNTTVGNEQSNPSIAVLDDGGYVVVWQSYSQDATSNWGVYGQRYDANDNVVGGEFRVNTTTAGSQYEAQVVGLANGGYVIVWRSDNQDGNGAGVYAQRYSADGAAVGGEFRINTTTASNQYQPSVAADASGGFVVAWYHDGYSAGNTEYADIFFQRYAADGSTLGGETRANPSLGSTFLYQSQPDITWLAGGGFVVVWTDTSGTDGNGSGVFGQVFDSAGNVAGNAFQVNSYITNAQDTPSIAALKDGGFVVAWESEGQDLSGRGVYAQRFDAAGGKVGAEFRVNTTISSTQYQPDVVGLKNGGWVVSWTDWGASNGYDVFVQQYDAAGRAVDGETRVNSYTPHYQSEPAIVATPDGGFVVVYTGYTYSGDGNGDGVADGGSDSYDIRLQRFSNTAPEISDVNVSGLEEAVIVLDYALFEINFNDADGQTLQAIRIVTLPANGSLKLDGVAVAPGQEIDLDQLQAGLLTYQGNVDFFGFDQFRWIGSDGIAFAANPVWTNITLSNVNDGPGLQPLADGTATEGTWFSRTITLTDPDREGARITVDWGDGSTPSIYNVSAGNSTTIGHAYADNGSYEVTVTADDRQGQPNSIEIDSFTITVNERPNSAPIARNDSYTADFGAALTVQSGQGVRANDSDADGDPLSISLVTTTANGSLELNADGSFIYTPNAGFYGTDSFTYQVSDGFLTDTASVSLTVRPSWNLTLNGPSALAPGQIGTASVGYTDTSANAGQPALVLVRSTGALVADPVTGQFNDNFFLLTSAGVTTALDVKMASSQYQSSLSAAIADATKVIDWVARSDLLKPEAISDAAWERAFTAFQIENGSTVGSFTAELAQSAARLSSFGIGANSAAAALAFELEQALDFGSLAARSAQGSLGTGWAFLGDLRLEIGTGGDAVLKGLASFDALGLLDARAVASYTLSASVDRAVGLGGGLGTALPVATTFTREITGDYAGGGTLGATLAKVAGGYTLTSTDGRVLRFDADGVLLGMVDSLGRETTAAHDEAGRLTGLSGPQGRALTITRDTEGKVTQIADANGHVVSLAYDAAGRLASSETAAGSAEFTYTGDGDLASSTTSGNPALSFGYDATGRLASIEAAGGGGSESYAYDGSGGYTVTDAAGRSTTVELLPGGAIGRITDGNGQSAGLVYDSTGKLIGIQGADGTTTSLGFDASGRLTTITDGNGAMLGFAYEGDATEPASFTDAGGNTRSFTYNDAGQIVRATWPDGTFLAFAYDANGHVTEATNRRGESVSYTYDDSGNLTGATQSDAGPASYSYDAAGRLTAIGTADGDTTIAYDAAGRVTEIAWPNGRSLAYTYDTAGRRTSLTDQDGNTTEYTYDAAGWLSAVSDGGGNRVDYAYDAAGNLTGEANSNGTSTSYAYDSAGRLVSIVNHDAAGEVTTEFHYSYNAAGQRSQAVTADGTWHYGYDAAGQLISADFTSTRASVADKSLAYAYDAAGNRISVTEDGVTTNYTANGLNQYTTVGDATYVYDSDGNMLSKTEGDDTWIYTWNTDNRLIRVTEPDGMVTEYAYDVFGNRSASVVDGVRTEYLVDPFGYGNVISEYGAGGSLTASYLHGLGLAARIGADGTGAFYDLDAVASVVGVSGADGSLANSYGYTPFGASLWEVEGIDNAFEFNGGIGVSEDANGLIYMRARAYEAELGRFLSEDPLWLSGDVANLYRFSGNDPISFLDPDGLERIPFRDSKAYSDYKSGFYGEGESAFRLALSIHDAREGSRERAEAANRSAEATGEALVHFGSAAWNLVTGSAALVTGNMLFGLVTRSPLGIGFNSYNSYKLIKGGKEFWDGVDDLYRAISGESFQDVVDRWYMVDVPKSPLPMAASDGDPHLRTFDGRSYSFQAVGEFTLIKGDDLEIQVRQEALGQNASINTAIAMRIGDDVVGIYAKPEGRVVINGVEVEIAQSTTVAVGDGAIRRYDFWNSTDPDRTVYEVVNEHGDGFWVNIYSGSLHLRPFIAEERAGAITGLLGNANGDNSDDMALRDGTQLGTTIAATVLYGEFADSWRITQEESLFLYGEGESTETFTNHNFPLRVITLADLDPDVRAAAEAIVRAAGVPEGTQAFDNAVLDVVLSGDPSFADAAGAAPPPEEEPVPIVVQRPPVANPDSAATDEDTAVIIDVLANDTDPEGDVLQVVGAVDPNGGTVDILDGGLLRFMPAADFHGVTTLRYTVSDGAGNLVEGTVEVTIEAVNDAPEPAPDVYEVSHGHTLDVGAQNGVLANDTDVDGDTLTVVSHGTATHGTLEIDADGAFRYTPNAGFVGTEVVEYTVSDGTVSATASLRISVGNTAPSLTLSALGETNEGDSFVLSIEAEDAEGGALGYSIDWGDGTPALTLTAAELAATSGLVTHTYADDAARTISVTATDSAGATTTRTHDVVVHNVAPMVALSGAPSVQAGVAYVLTLGEVIDPGDDTVSQYIVDWGDGSEPQTVTSVGEVSHTYASVGSRTISVTLVDEDGSFANPTTLQLDVGAPSDTVIFDAGANVTLDEGTTFNRTIVFSDGEDNGAAGWIYTIDYGDGTIDTGITLEQSLELSHLYADGDAVHTVTVTLTDEEGETVSDNFTVQVDDVVPVIALSGLPEVDAGMSYTLNLGAITDPGDDTVISYIVNWGDGSSNAYDAAGEVTHTFAAEGNYTISVDLVDEDDTHTAAGTLAVAVNSVIIPDGVSVNAGIDAIIDEGSLFTRTITFADGEDTGADGWTYSVDWGNDSVIETGSIAAGASSFDISRFFADGDAGHDISVTVTDVAGDSDTQQFRLDVNNVAPVIALSGLSEVNAGVSYTLNLGAITDPGDDTVTSYIVNWGDDSSDIYDVAGEVTHTFAAEGNYTISVDLVDEDGTHADAGSLDISVNASSLIEVTRIGDAPARVTNTAQLVNAWSDPLLDSIVHKSDATNPDEAWTPVTLGVLNTQVLAGGDLYAGDLGVSGQSIATSTVAQELDGNEVLRFEFNEEATSITANLTRFYSKDMGSSYSEAGRMQLFDKDGVMVDETIFVADALNGQKTISITPDAKFTAVEFSAGIYDGNQFVFGALATEEGDFGTQIYANSAGALNGSDFLIDWIEPTFEISLVGHQDDILI